VRAAIVFFSEKYGSRTVETAKGLARGMEAAGCRADLVDGLRETGKRLSSYDSLVLCCEALTFFSGKISEKIPVFLAGAGLVSGKRSYAFISGRSFSANRALSRLMRAMEKEGLFLRYSEVLSSPAHAESVGRSVAA